VPENALPDVYALEGWEIDLRRRELRADGAVILLGRRAFDILEVLVKAGGQLVTKNELLAHVWAGVAVEENTLQVHISALRRALGTQRRLLITSSGRGYRLLGDWSLQQPSLTPAIDPPARATRSSSRKSNLPLSVSELIGRGEVLDRVAELAEVHRIVTLTGPGGIGKTRLAIETARRLMPLVQGDIHLIELASLSDPNLVPTAVASVLGLEFGETGISHEAVAQAIGDQHILLVLDNCEHLIGAAATLAETILARCRMASVLATSVEPLRIDGEYIFRVPPLDTQASLSANPADLATLSAVQLFIARARALRADFDPEVGALQTIATICRHLDGLPLAIEFAAANSATLGVDVILSRLDDRFGLLTGGRRTAQPRHRSLRAVLDWSYDLLSAEEKRLLRVASIFPGGFTLEAARSVAGAGVIPDQTIEGIASLVGKSLLVLDDSAVPVRWRMLDTTRAYAFEKLVASGEANVALRLHAEFLCVLFPQVTLASQTRAQRENMQVHAREIDNVRAALDWAFSPAGDAELGVRLTAAFVPVWLNLSLLAECNAAVEHALERLPPELLVGPKLRMQLQVALAVALLCSLGSLHRAGELVAAALALAEELSDAHHQLLALYADWCFRSYLGEQRQALRAAERFAALAAGRSDAVHTLISERMIGTALHYAGDQKQARQRLASMLAQAPDGEEERYAISHHFDHRVVARSIHARALCVLGQLDSARSEAAASVEDASGTGWGLEVRYPLAWAVCPVAMMVGDLDVAGRALSRLQQIRNGSNLAFWVGSVQCLEGSFVLRQGHHARAAALLGPALETCRNTGWMPCYAEFLGAFAEALAGLGRWDEALTALAQALRWSDETGEAWYVAELHRLKGDMLLQREAGRGHAAAEACFMLAGDVGRQQGALLWELRAMLSLARLRVLQSRDAEARSLLAPVYGRFTEGFDSADLQAVSRLLNGVG